MFLFISSFAGSFGACDYDELKGGVRNYKKENYAEQLDPNKYIKGTDEEIRKRIEEKIHKCGIFIPFSNNCETLSNYVRYGKEITAQVCARLNHITMCAA